MTSGRRTVGLACLALAMAQGVAVGVAIGVGAPALAEPSLAGLDLPGLMQSLARRGSGSARFTERKYLALLAAPLVSTGLLSFRSPDRLEKRTDAPQFARLAIDGNAVTIERINTVPKHFSLDDAPEIASLVSGLRATLAGDLPTLERLYTLSLQGSASAWRLDLLPRDPHVRTLVASIRIDGTQDRLVRVETIEADGDRTELSIENGTAP